MSSIQSNISNYSNPTAPGKANLIILIGLIQDLDVFDLVHTFQAPQANSFAEHWVRSVREECLDHILIVNQNHLRRVSKEYINYYNHHRRPHQGIDQTIPYFRAQTQSKWTSPKSQYPGRHHPRLLSTTIFF